MKITEIKTGVKRLVNIGNFENVTFTIETIVEIEKSETEDEAYDRGMTFCKEQTNKEVKALKTKLKKLKK